jgi:hypothetical protein
MLCALDSLSMDIQKIKESYEQAIFVNYDLPAATPIQTIKSIAAVVLVPPDTKQRFDDFFNSKDIINHKKLKVLEFIGLAIKNNSPVKLDKEQKKIHAMFPDFVQHVGNLYIRST